MRKWLVQFSWYTWKGSRHTTHNCKCVVEADTITEARRKALEVYPERLGDEIRCAWFIV